VKYLDKPLINKKLELKLGALLLALLVICGTLFFSVYATSALVFLVCFYVSSVIAIYYYSGRVTADFRNQIKILLYSSSVYFLYSFFSYINYRNTGSFFIFPDQNHFFGISDELKSLPSIYEIFKKTIVEKSHIENEGAYFLLGLIGFISNKYLGENTVLIQSLAISSFAVFINIFIYKTLLFYVNRKHSFTYTLLFASFSMVMAYSPWLLRDIHILFFYTLGFYLIHKDFSFTVLFLLLVIQYVVSEFRFESGLAFTFFPFIYVFLQGKEYKHKKLLYLLLVVLLVPISIKGVGVLGASVNKLSAGMNKYQSYTADAVQSSAGLASIFYKLPPGLKHIGITVFSQMQPFPPWNNIESANNLFEILVFMLFGISGIFWFYVVFIALQAFIRHYRVTPRMLLFALFFAVVFLLGNTSNMNIRRIMAVYPIVYVYFVYAQTFLNKKLRKKLIYFIVLYMWLLLAYILLKFL